MGLVTPGENDRSSSPLGAASRWMKERMNKKRRVLAILVALFYEGGRAAL
jgi:hypothetical protein